MATSSTKLSFISKISYGSGNFAANLMNCTVGTYISYYYTDVAGLPIAAVGLILLCCRILDGVTDLAMGMIVERTRTARGKARPWLLRMAIPFGLAIFLMFFSPNWGVTGKIIYAAATYIAGIAVIYTAINVPYNVLSALVTKDQNERTALATTRQFFGFLGPLVITTISIPVINYLGAGQFAWSVLTCIYGLLGTMIYLWIYYSVDELSTPETNNIAKQNKTNKPYSWQAVNALFRNEYWFIVLIITFVIFINYAVKGGTQLYFTKYVLGDSNFYSWIAAASQIPNIICCFFIPALAKKYGKRNLSLIGCVIAIVGGAIMAINPIDPTIILTSTVINSIGMAPICVCCFAMLGDTAVYGKWKTNIGNEGLIFSAMTFAEKVGYAVGGGITAFALAAVGFIGNEVTQNPQTLEFLRLSMVWFPVIVSLILIIALIFYKLDNLYMRILTDLERGK